MFILKFVHKKLTSICLALGAMVWRGAALKCLTVQHLLGKLVMCIHDIGPVFGMLINLNYRSVLFYLS